MSENPNNPYVPPEKELSDQQAERQLNDLGRSELQFLRSDRPKTYKRLQKAESLNRYALQRQRAAEASLDRLVQAGVNPEEAYELVSSQYLQLPEP